MVESTSDLLTCKTNQEFKTSALAHPFIALLLSLLKDQYNTQKLTDDHHRNKTNGQALLQTIKKATLDFSCEDFESLVNFIFGFYLRENSLGPSVYTEYVEETRAPLVKGELPITEFDPISFKNKLLQHALLEHF